MTQMESQPFLNYLYLHAMNKSIMHRFQWEKDSVILWVREKKTKKKIEKNLEKFEKMESRILLLFINLLEIV